MNALFVALQNKYEASGSLATQTNGLWYQGEEHSRKSPYLTFLLVSDTADYTMGTSSKVVENCLMQLSVWYEDNSEEADSVNGLERITVLFDLMTTLFDEASLTIAGYTLIRCFRESSNLLRDPDGGWAYHTTYRMWLQEV